LAAWLPTGYDPFDDKVGEVFVEVLSCVDGLDDDTLLMALQYGGGPGELGAARILLRAAVAALLNAAHDNVNYPRTVVEVITAVNAALDSCDRSTMLSLATKLDTDNNLGCPLGQPYDVGY
jgi:hypothetical protein